MQRLRAYPNYILEKVSPMCEGDSRQAGALPPPVDGSWIIDEEVDGWVTDEIASYGITAAMLKAGVVYYNEWDPEEEGARVSEIVARIYAAMRAVSPN